MGLIFPLEPVDFNSSFGLHGVMLVSHKHAQHIIIKEVATWEIFKDLKIRVGLFNAIVSRFFSFSETSRQIPLPKKQRLINRKGHRHAANEGMDSYR